MWLKQEHCQVYPKIIRRVFTLQWILGNWRVIEQVLVHLSYMKSTVIQSPAPHFFLNTTRTDFWAPPNVTDYKIRDIVNIIRCSFSECEETYWTKVSHTNSVLFFFFSENSWKSSLCTHIKVSHIHYLTDVQILWYQQCIIDMGFFLQMYQDGAMYWRRKISPQVWKLNKIKMNGFSNSGKIKHTTFQLLIPHGKYGS